MARLSTIDILGAGPAGLYTAILFKRAMPGARVRLLERNPPDATFGFGVVFSDRALDFLAVDDPEIHELLVPNMERWRNMTLVHRGEAVVIDGVGFSAIGRLALLRLLQARAGSLGVELEFGARVTATSQLAADLIVGADGVHSMVRAEDEPSFAPEQQFFANRFAWFGTPRRFATLTQTFVHTEHGPLNAHHYRYSGEMSTFIVEVDPKTFAAAGFDAMSEGESARACAAMFADALDGAPLVANQSLWRRFPLIWCERWVSGNRALVGDAAHTAHYSIGSGTRLAMEDAIALVDAVVERRDLADGLAAYQAGRPPVARKIVEAANTSATWYERYPAAMTLTPYAFALDYIMRSGRIDAARLRRQSPRFVADYEASTGRRIGDVA